MSATGSGFLLSLCRRLGLTEDIGIVVLSRRLLAFAISEPDRVAEVSLLYQADAPPLPPARLPPIVRDGLTTRRHLGEIDLSACAFVRDEMLNFDVAQDAIHEAIHLVTTRRSRLIKPRVVIATASDHSAARKRALLDATERAGARQIFLVDMALPCALGLGLDVLNENVHGVFLLEDDWCLFAVMSYADILARRFIPVGAIDVPNPHQHSDWRDCILDAIAATLAELRPAQSTRLLDAGIHFCGRAEDPDWIKAFNKLLGMKCEGPPTPLHPAALGLRNYLKHLDEWKPTMTNL